MKAGLRTPRDFTEVLGYTWRVYLGSFPTLFGIALIVAPVAMLQAVVLRSVDGESARYAVSWAFFAPVLFVSAIAECALIVAVHDVTGGTRAEAGRSVDLVFERIVSVVGTVLLYLALLVASLFSPLLAIWWVFRRDATIDGRRNWWLVLIPFVLPFYLATRWWFFLQALMIEDHRRWRALDASATTVRGQWWRAFGGMAFLVAFGLAGGSIAAFAADAPVSVDVIVSGAVAALFLPFVVTAQTLWYYALLARKAADAHPAPVDAP